jgi:hypothetical protein
VLSVVRSKLIQKRAIVEPIVELEAESIAEIISKSEQIEEEGK